MPFDSQGVSPEGVSVEPALPVRHLQQQPGIDGLYTVQRGQAGGAFVVSDEEALQLAPDGYGDGLCLAEMLARWVSGAGELIAQDADIWCSA